MTRKDYVLIAAALALNLDDCAEHGYNNAGAIGAAIALADALAAENPRFDRARFLKACGVAT